MWIHIYLLRRVSFSIRTFTFPTNYCEMEKLFQPLHFSLRTITSAAKHISTWGALHTLAHMQKQIVCIETKWQKKPNCKHRQVKHEKLFPSFVSWWVLLIDNVSFQRMRWQNVKRPHLKKQQLDSIYLHNKLNTLPFAYSRWLSFVRLVIQNARLGSGLVGVGFLWETNCVCVYIWIHLLAFVTERSLQYILRSWNLRLNACENSSMHKFRFESHHIL